MRSVRRVTASFGTPLLLLAGVAGCGSGVSSADGGSLVIAAELDKSSVVDIAYARALQLRIDQVNASGRLGARKLVLRSQDDQSDPTMSLRDISAFGDDRSVVALVTGQCDECVVGAAKTIDAAQLPTIALAPADQVAAPVADRHFVFQLNPSSAGSATVLVAELARAGIHKVAVVYADDLYGRGDNAALDAQLAKSGISVADSRPIKPTATDISQPIGTLTGGNPDALLVLAGPEQAQLAATSARAAGYRGHLYFDAAAADEQFIAPAAAAAENDASMIATPALAIDDVIATTPAKAAGKQWFRDYASRYGTYSGVGTFAADAVDLIADAVVRAGSDRARIRDILETAQLDGLAGPIRFTPDNHSGLLPQALTVLVARSGRWRL